MLNHRVIPCLLLKGNGLYKTTQFKNPKYVGDPLNAIRIFNDKEVEELIVLDIAANKTRTEPNYETIAEFASECFMPLCYGGGIRNPDQAKKLFDLGVEKISLQTAALEDITIISKIAKIYGSQSVVVSLDIKKNLFGKYQLYSSASGKKLSLYWTDFLKAAVSEGAGEIVINSVDRDGMMEGMDFDLIKLTSSEVSVPVIAMGGASEITDFKKAIDAGASAVAAGAMFVYQKPHRAVLITYPEYSTLEKLLAE